MEQKLHISPLNIKNYNTFEGELLCFLVPTLNSDWMNGVQKHCLTICLFSLAIKLYLYNCIYTIIIIIMMFKNGAYQLNNKYNFVSITY